MNHRQILLIIGWIVLSVTGVRAQAPSSVAGLTYRQDMTYVLDHFDGYLSTTLQLDGTYIDRLGVAEMYNTPMIYGTPSSGTYQYVVTAPNQATLTFTPSTGTSIGYVLTFTSPTQGTVAYAGPSTETSGKFYLSQSNDEASGRALVNLSTMLVAKQGTPATIGFVVGGSVPREVLIRVIGPSLAAFHIQNFAPNPTYKITGLPKEWGGLAGEIVAYMGYVGLGWSATPDSTATLTAENARAGAFPLALGSNDKADVTLLYPGHYTISVTPTSASGEGVVLVEVYEVP